MKNSVKIILDKLNSLNINWAIIHKEDEIFNGIENDVDILISKEKYERFIFEFKIFLKENQFKILLKKEMTAGISYSLFNPQFNEFIKFDFLFDLTIKFISFLNLQKLLEIDYKNGYPVLLKKKSSILNEYKILFRKNPIKYYKTKIKTNKIFFKKFPKLYLLNYLQASITNFNNSRKGKFIVLVGPDGSGKSTISHIISTELKKIFFSVKNYHFSYRIFPRLNKLKLKPTPEPDYTLSNSGTNSPIQPMFKAIIYCLYYGLESIIGSNLFLTRLTSRGSLIIYDRFIHDYFFQRSYRKAPSFLIRTVLNLCKKPDLIIYLHGSPKKINLRKDELSESEISIQQKLIESRLIPFWTKKRLNILKIDTTSDSDFDIIDIIFDKLFSDVKK